jgi:hypothetical protein
MSKENNRLVDLSCLVQQSVEGKKGRKGVSESNPRGHGKSHNNSTSLEGERHEKNDIRRHCREDMDKKDDMGRQNMNKEDDMRRSEARIA